MSGEGAMVCLLLKMRSAMEEQWQLQVTAAAGLRLPGLFTNRRVLARAATLMSDLKSEADPGTKFRNAATENRTLELKLRSTAYLSS